MTLETILEYALPIALVLLAIVAIWLVVEAALTMRTTRLAVSSMQEQLSPTLEKVDAATAALVPALEKMDPLMDRVNLSVDAVNLEIMRVDTILEEVGEAAKNLNQASVAATAMVNAPQDAISQVTAKVRKALSPRAASDESMAIGAAKEAQAKKAAKPASTQQVLDAMKAVVSPVAAAVQDGTAQKAAEKKVAEAVDRINAAAKNVQSTAQEAATSAKDAAKQAESKAADAAAPSYYTYESSALSANASRMAEAHDQE